MFEEYKKPLPIPSEIDLPENVVMKKYKEIHGPVTYEFLKFDPRYPLDMQESLGTISAMPSNYSDELITMSGNLSPELERKGIGRQIYAMAERDTGKKVLPDTMLSEKSSGIHNKYGLGKEFGLDDYEGAIKKGIAKRTEQNNLSELAPTKQGQIRFKGSTDFIPDWPEQAAKEGYEAYIDKVKKHGVKGIKSIAPILKPIGMGLSAAAALGYSDIAGAATDIATGAIGGVEEMGVSDEQKMLDQRYLKRIKQMQENKK